MTNADSTAAAKITDLLNDVTEFWGGDRYSTHHEFCYRVHAGCLAHRIRALMEETDEWEYAVQDYRPRGYILLGDDPLSTAARLAYYGERPLIRRRPAGQWEPVEAAENTP